MPSGWTARQEPDGRWCYQHTLSGVTQWTPPRPEGSLSPTLPVPHHPRFSYNQLVEFKLREKYFSLSGDSFEIKNVTTDRVAFKVKGNPLSFRDSKALSDDAGNELYKISESMMSLHGRMQIVDVASKDTVLTVKKKSLIPKMGRVQAWRGETDDGEADIECEGDILKKDFTIKEKPTGTLLATIKRKTLSVSNIVFDKDHYIVRVEPGVDAAMMVFLVIALDEQYHD